MTTNRGQSLKAVKRQRKRTFPSPDLSRCTRINKKATSFIGEHTAEFVLVPMLKRILQKEFEFVTPIFPWLTREGSNISKSLHQNDKFNILGLYPRRPKIAPLDKTIIHLKINEQIILGAQSGLNLGIPIIAGCPLAKDFWELGKNPNCLWIRLNFESKKNKEFKIKQGKSLHVGKDLSRMVFQKENEILKYTKENAYLFNVTTAMEAFRKIKMDSVNLEYYSSFAFWGGYKPIYFLLK